MIRISFRLYLLRYFSFYKPSSNIISIERVVSFKEKVALLPVNPHRVSITLSPGFRSCGRTDIGNTVNLIFMAVFPCDLAWQHNTIIAEADNHIHIHFYIVHAVPPTDYTAHMDHSPLQ